MERVQVWRKWGQGVATAVGAVAPWRAVAVRGAMVAAFCAAASSGAVAETYSFEQLGLTGVGYTGAYTSSGYAVSEASTLNEAGQVIGYSQRYNGTTSTGQAAWLHSQGVTQQIGLTGEGYTDNSSGYAFSVASALNEAGQVIGDSSRYNGTTSTGQAAWLHSQGVTQQVGLTGEGYTDNSSGYAVSVASALNDAGQVIGYSSRYNGTTSTGWAAWLYSQGVTQQIGLTGEGYTDNSSGYARSLATALNEAGQVIGSSARYSGATTTGQAAWLYSQGVTQQIGLTGVGYTNTSGYAYSQAAALNEAGQVIGSSARYSGATTTGQAAWLYSQGVTQQIGLTGVGYTNTSGYAYSQAAALNEAGQVIGSSVHYGGATGQAAWLYSQGVTQQIGLTGVGYTNTSGYAYSQAAALNEAGQVIGYSSRYNGTADTGRAVWLYSQGATQQIGLIGAGYTNTSSGYAFSEVAALNEAGQVIGYSRRYKGATSIGQTAWFFDDDLNQTFALEFSVRSTDGYAYSEASFLGEDGLVLGRFEAYSGATYLGRRAFAWTVEDGLQDLGLLIEGGLEPDWTSLASVYQGNAAGQIVGYGNLASGGRGAFLLTPVPEPESWALLLAGMGLTGWAAAPRRRRVSAKLGG